MNETPLFSISSWTRVTILKFGLLLWFGVYFSQQVSADTVLFGKFPDVPENSLVSGVFPVLAEDIRAVFQDADGCEDVLGAKAVRLRDGLRTTSVAAATLRAECWAVLQLDPGASVVAAGPQDGIPPDIVWEVMAWAERLSLENEEWAKTLMVIPKGTLLCEAFSGCRLERPDGHNPPEEALHFDLMAAAGETRFIMVTQMVYGRAGFVYALRWQQDAGAVVAVFPEF